MLTMKIVWVYTWYDPGKEADAANALIAQGADVSYSNIQTQQQQ